MYTKVFVEIYYWHSRKLVHKTYKIVEIEKYSFSRAKNPWNLSDQRFYKISKILQGTYVVPKDHEDNAFYLNNYINWDQFN